MSICFGNAHKGVLRRPSLPGVEEQKAIKSFSIWALLMASFSKSSSDREEVFPGACTESFNHTTPWFSRKTRFGFLLLPTTKGATFSSKPLFNCSYQFTFHCLSFTHTYTHTSEESSFQQLLSLLNFRWILMTSKHQNLTTKSDIHFVENGTNIYQLVI